MARKTVDRLPYLIPRLFRAYIMVAFAGLGVFVALFVLWCHPVASLVALSMFAIGTQAGAVGSYLRDHMGHDLMCTVSSLPASRPEAAHRAR